MEKYIREGGDFVREIKFRGYAVEKMMGSQWLTGFGVDSIEYSDQYAKEIGRKEDWYLYTDNGPMIVEKDSIGQYTGLKDKNGREIYEGDIVKYRQRNLNNAFGGKGEPWEENIRVIEWFNNGWTIPRGFVKDIEVIGNKYSNPELLEN